MSLDVYLHMPPTTHACENTTLRCSDCGHEIEHQHEYTENHTVFLQNITHNLSGMASAAGIYEACWCPGEMLAPEVAARMKVIRDARSPDGLIDWLTYNALEETLPTAHARDLIGPLTAGLAWLRDNRAEAEKHNPENGWGDYKGFVPWVEKYLKACKENPDALVRASR
jgi:hypothetical protein